VATRGQKLDDAQAMAEEALALHVDRSVEDAEALPESFALDAVMKLPDSKGGVAIRVAVKTEAPKCIRLNVTLPEDILEQSAFLRVRRSANWMRRKVIRRAELADSETSSAAVPWKDRHALRSLYG
jgi:HicB_like antitoxin of bacterial toxin-antitoxin system